MAESRQNTSSVSTWMNRLRETFGTEFGVVIEKIRNSPLSDQLRSWIGKGENQPVTADQITAVLGEKLLAKIAEQTGVDRGQAARNIANKLPEMVDEMTPEGGPPAPADANSDIESLMRDATGKPLGGGAGPPM